MRIVHFFRSNIMAGAEHVIYDIVRSLADDPNYCVSVITGGERVKVPFEALGIPVHVQKNCNPFALRSKIRAFSPHLIHAHDNQASVLSALAMPSVPIISHVHNYYRHYEVNGLYRTIDWLMKNRYTLSIYCSDLLKKRIETNCPSAVRKRSLVLNNPIDIERIRALAAKTNDVHNPPEDRPWILGFFGRFTEDKGLLGLIRAASSFKQRFERQRIRMVLTGDGEQREALIAAICEHGLEAYVTVRGFCDNPYPLIAASDMIILPSLREGLPIVLLEAAALKVPLSATDTGGVGRFVIDGQTGWLSKPGDFDGFLNKTLDRARIDHTKITDRAYARVLQDYNIVDYMERLKAVYASLLEQTSKTK